MYHNFFKPTTYQNGMSEAGRQRGRSQILAPPSPTYTHHHRSLAPTLQLAPQIFRPCDTQQRPSLLFKNFPICNSPNFFKCETIWSVGQSILDCNPMIQALYFKQNSSHLLHCVSKVKIDKKYVMWLVPPDYKN